MGRRCSVILLLLMGLIAESSYAELIIKFTVQLNPDTHVFNVFIEDFAPEALNPGEEGNGGISGFAIDFHPGQVTSLTNARLRGEDFGSIITGFDLNGEDAGNGIGAGTPGLFGIQEDDGIVYGFGQTSGEIPNLNFLDFDPTLDGPIPFSKPAFIGSGVFAGSADSFMVMGVGANVFTHIGASPDGTGIVEISNDETSVAIQVIPEPSSLLVVMILGGTAMFKRGRGYHCRCA